MLLIFNIGTLTFCTVCDDVMKSFSSKELLKTYYLSRLSCLNFLGVDTVFLSEELGTVVSTYNKFILLNEKQIVFKAFIIQNFV